VVNDNSREKNADAGRSIAPLLDATDVQKPLSDTAANPSPAYDPFCTEVPSARREEGRFRFLRPLAEGNLGVVSVALDTELNREIALKRIRQNLASNTEFLDRFAREAEVTGALEHPGVVPVYGYGKMSVGSCSTPCG
jgi:eukaryotic-like serine/threonine-protein kinase